MHKRKYSISIALISMTSLVLLAVNCSKQDLSAKAAKIHDEALTIDTHTDTPIAIAHSGYDIGERHESGSGGGKIDLPRMKEGGLDAVFFAVFISQGPRTEEGNENAKIGALSVFDAIHNAVKKYTDLAELAFSSDDAYRIEKSGKRAIYVGIENGYAIGKDLTLIKRYYDLGARYITLCHTSNNDICDSSTDQSEHGGLSEFGEKVVSEMNRLGMLVDVSHASDETFYDVAELSKAPIIASHSCARAICDHPRNLDDEMLKTLAENGGVIQMCILSDYVREPEPNPEREKAFEEFRKNFGNYEQMSPEEQQKAREKWQKLQEKYPQKLATVSDVVDHIDHIVKVAGIDHIGIGTDFDGGGGVDGCNDVSQMGNITLELVKRGYTKQEIRKIWGGNFLRVFREAEKISADL